MSRRSHRTPWLLGALLAVGCSTPSVPLPPPGVDVSALSFQQAAPGQFVLTGKPSVYHDNALFYVLDRENGDGVITTAASDGSFTTAGFAAAVGDTVRVQYVIGDITSVASCVRVVLDGPLADEHCK